MDDTRRGEIVRRYKGPYEAFEPLGREVLYAFCCFCQLPANIMRRIMGQRFDVFERISIFRIRERQNL